MSHVINRFLDSFREKHNPHPYVLDTLGLLARCRTAALGSHLDRCDHCGHEHVSYNSCRNRHCTKCQGRQREIWIGNIMEMLPPCGHFHVVFTLPGSLNPLFLSHKDLMQDILFRAAWKTIICFAADPAYLGAESGMIAVLHTWGQTLGLHPHLHCILPEGGIDRQGRWVKARHASNDSPFLFPVKKMGVVFRGIFLSMMSRALKKKDVKVPTVAEKAFNVFAKRPFRSAHTIVEYLARYTHKVAISNSRIRQIDDRCVTFQYKDYRDGRSKFMTLPGEEFLRRFSLHIQNKGFRKVRRYGIFSPSKRRLLEQAKKHIKAFTKEEWKTQDARTQMEEPDLCPACNKGRMRLFRMIESARPPPSGEYHAGNMATC